MIPRVVRRLGVGLASRIPYSITRRLVDRNVISVVYHVVADHSLPHIDHLYPYKSPFVFDKDLVELKNSYDLLSYKQLKTRLEKGGSSRTTAGVITIDDGYAEAFSCIRPILISHGVDAIFFVPTNFVSNRSLFYRNKASLCVDKFLTLDDRAKMEILVKTEELTAEKFKSPSDLERCLLLMKHSDISLLNGICDLLEIDEEDFLSTVKPYMTDLDIKKLVDDGFTIGSHSRSHAPVEAYRSYDELEEEIVESCSAIRDLTGQSEVPFSFPFSADGVDESWLDGIVAKYDFVGLTFGTGGLRHGPRSLLNRVAMDSPKGCNYKDGSRSNVSRLMGEAYGKQVMISAFQL